MIDVEVLSRRHPGKLLELLDEVHLIIVTRMKQQVHPIGLGLLFQQSEHIIEAGNPGVGLRRDTHLGGKLPLQSPGAHIEFFGQFLDGHLPTTGP